MLKENRGQYQAWSSCFNCLINCDGNYKTTDLYILIGTIGSNDTYGSINGTYGSINGTYGTMIP